MRTSVLFLAALSLAACHHRPPVVTAPLLAPGIPPMAGAEQVALALRFVDGRMGTGATISPRQCMFVHYTGWLRDGTKFDSSRDTMPNGTPRTPIGFPLGVRRVIVGWDLGLEGLKVGGLRRLFVPYALAYGEAGRPPVIPEKSDLIFDVELIAISDTLSRAESTPQRGPLPQCPTWAVVKERAGL